MTAAGLPPPGLAGDVKILYDLVMNVDKKLDDFMERFVPRPEIDSRFAAQQAQILNQVEENRKVDRRFSIQMIIYSVSASAAVGGVVAAVLHK